MLETLKTVATLSCGCVSLIVLAGGVIYYGKKFINHCMTSKEVRKIKKYEKLKKEYQKDEK